ncbi:SGNH/GDSL hydrolase family protein [Paractinoplanes globisporus]|uniref:SGNH/GDSL hydrolase family protein n=1 Tax=Paractinoplanes globisporus TaxID=113565 RepID=A0ABW6WE55_9ACTN|nr:SGNH/GDSL hydrolase family protein [Actinoplanes globisporus]
MRRAAVLLSLLLLTACSSPRVAAGDPLMPTVVTLGDSVPAGAACGCDPFPTLYARDQHAVDVNLAESGSTAADVRAEIPAESDVLATAAEVVIMTGANDVADTIDDNTSYTAAAAGVQSDVTATIAAIEQIRPVPVIVLGYWNVVEDGQVGADTYGPDGVRDAAEATTLVNNALEAAAKTSPEATYISTLPAFHGQDGTHDPTGLLAPDGDHPNAAGHAAIAALLPPLPASPPPPASPR